MAPPCSEVPVITLQPDAAGYNVASAAVGMARRWEGSVARRSWAIGAATKNGGFDMENGRKEHQHGLISWVETFLSAQRVDPHRFFLQCFQVVLLETGAQNRPKLGRMIQDFSSISGRKTNQKWECNGWKHAQSLRIFRVFTLPNRRVHICGSWRTR